MALSRIAPSLLLPTLVAAGLAAQPKPPETAPKTFSMAKEYRAVQLGALETQRKLLLSFADSMPEKLYGERATPAQRSFAGQLHHIASAGPFIASMFIKPGPPPAAADTIKIFASRAAMKEFINQQYDFQIAMLKGQADDERDVQVKFFGGKFIPRWQVWDELNQHAMWTAGQMVANFRKNNMAPPSFLFF